MAGFRQLLQARLATQQQQFATHPDAGLLSAFAEDHLRGAERAGVVAHLARCDECRHILALLETVEGSVAFLVDTPRASGWGAGIWRWRMAAVAAIPLLALLAIIRLEPPQNRMNAVTPTKPRTLTPTVVQSPPSIPKNTPRQQDQIRLSMVTPPIRRERLSPEAPGQQLSDVLEPSAPQKMEQKNLQPAAQVSAASLPVIQLSRSAVLEPAPLSSEGQQQDVPSQTQPPAQQSKSAFQFARPTFGAIRSGFVNATPVASVAMTTSLWALDAPRDDVTSPESGTVARSTDGGKTWQPVTVSPGVRFTALCANGPEIWIGGEMAALFHSADDGATWIPINVVSGDTPLTGTITRLISPVPDRIELQTQTDQRRTDTWVSLDRGAHWTKR